MEKKNKKERAYALKKNFFNKPLRIIFWIMLTFVFVRGVYVCIKPENEDVINNTIKNFREEFKSFKGENEEIMGFTSNFIYEYLTYDIKGEEDFRSRLKPYVYKEFNYDNIYDFKSSARAVYVEPYKKVEYGPNQYDVYVNATVEYVIRNVAEDGTEIEVTESRDTVTLRVPVYVEHGFYVIEGCPQYITDTMLLTNHSVPDYSGKSLSEKEEALAEDSIENFLKAYYEEKQSVIDYYLTDKTNKEIFAGLNGRYEFVKMEELKIYTSDSGEITALADYSIKDRNNSAIIRQKINLTLVKIKDKYYIQDMNTKTGNLRID